MTRRHKLLGCVLIVVVLAAATQLTTSGQIASCFAADIVGLYYFIPICIPLNEYAEGRLAIYQDPRAALRQLDEAVRARPTWAMAHVALGEAAEELGNFDAALLAYQRAIGLDPAPDHQVHLLRLAGRMGRLDMALASLEAARPTRWQRTRAAFWGGVGAALTCAVDARARGGSAMLMCPKPAWNGAVHTWRAAAEETPQEAFALLVENGRRAEALALARARGWTAPGVDYCTPSRDSVVTEETAALLAVLVHPDRADCAIAVGVGLTDAGLSRRARFVLADRAAHASTDAGRRYAARFMKYRLPAHDVVKLAESLNVTGYRLQYRYRLADEAIAVYQHAIAADPRFSWPYHNLGIVYLDRGDYGRAEAWIAKAVGANADHWRAWRNYALALHNLKRYADAVAAYERALRIEPDDAEALAGLGRTLMAAGREAEGLRAMQAAVRLNPNLTRERQVVETYLGRDARQAPTANATIAVAARAALDPGRALDRARAAYQAGRYAAALREARAATNAEPRSLPAALLRAQMAAFMGEFDEARAAYATAALLGPDDPRRLYAAATFAVQIGAYDEAVRDLDRMVTLQPSSVQLLFEHAPAFMQTLVRETNPALEQVVQVKIDVLLEKGDLAGARQLARAHRIVNSGGGYCRAVRDRMGGGSARRDATFQAFRLAVLGEPEAADCIWWYGQWLTDEGYLRLGRLMVREGARATSSQSNKDSADRFIRVRLGPEVPKAAEQLFQIARQRYLRDGDVDGAVRLFDEAARQAPGFARPYLYRARIAEDDGDVAAAIGWLERAIATDSDSWRAHRNLGMLLARQERWEDAERELRRTVTLFDDDPGGRLALARVLYAEGQHAEFSRYAHAAVQFATAYGGASQVADIAAFLTRFDRWGPGVALPPAPDPHVLLGWNYD